MTTQEIPSLESSEPGQSVYLPPRHHNQQKAVQRAKRFNILKCGRRWGKTELAIDLTTEALCEGQRVAYYTPTYKDVHETWQQIKSTLHDVIASKDETIKQLKTIAGGVLDLWSMDNPDSGRGRKYHLVIIDECEKALKFEQAWTQTILPTLTDFKGVAWFLSTPKFGKTFFKEMYRKAADQPDWTVNKFTTYDNPFMDRAEIELHKRTIDSMTFRCEYMADDVDLSLNPFAYAFSKEKHVRATEMDAGGYLQLSFDFNVDPITCLALQSPETGVINILQEFRLENSDIYELCARIKAAYPPGVVHIITGDATGRARSALTRGNTNYYTAIKNELGLVNTQIKTPAVNPAVSDTRVLLNSLLQNGQISIDPSCEYLIEDLIYCEVDDKGDIDKKQDKHKTHLLDCLRYGANSFHRSFINI